MIIVIVQSTAIVCSPYRSALSDTLTEHHSWQESHHYHEDCSDVKRVTEGERVREKNKEICLRCRVWVFRGKKHHAELVTCQNQETKTVTGKLEDPHISSFKNFWVGLHGLREACHDCTLRSLVEAVNDH